MKAARTYPTDSNQESFTLRSAILQQQAAGHEHPDAGNSERSRWVLETRQGIVPRANIALSTQRSPTMNRDNYASQREWLVALLQEALDVTAESMADLDNDKGGESGNQVS